MNQRANAPMCESSQACMNRCTVRFRQALGLSSQHINFGSIHSTCAAGMHWVVPAPVQCLLGGVYLCIHKGSRYCAAPNAIRHQGAL